MGRRATKVDVGSVGTAEVFPVGSVSSQQPVLADPLANVAIHGAVLALAHHYLSVSSPWARGLATSTSRWEMYAAYAVLSAGLSDGED